MNLEDFETYWQNRRFEGYLFDTPRSQIVADIRLSAQVRQQKYVRRSCLELGILVIVTLMALAAIALATSPAARSGIALVAAGLVLQLLPIFRLNSMERNKRYDLGQEASLLDERKRVVARIRHSMRQTTWHMLPIIFGAILICIAQGRALDTITGFVTGLVATSAVIHIYLRRKARKTLIPIIEEIDRELKILHSDGGADGI